MHYKFTLTPNVECSQCSQAFYKPPSRVTPKNFCSMACRSAHARVDRVCESCGITFSVTHAMLRQATGAGRFCGRQCRKQGRADGLISNAKKSMPPFEDRFWSRVDTSGGDEACWLWTGGSARYGRMKRYGKMVFAHRASWEMANGPIPDGLFICHHCDTPKCVNPSHLFLGTAADNKADSVVKGRHVHATTHPKAKLTPDQVVEIRSRYVKRYGAIAELAREYGVSTGAIQGVVTRLNWREV